MSSASPADLGLFRSGVRRPAAALLMAAAVSARAAAPAPPEPPSACAALATHQIPAEAISLPTAGARIKSTTIVAADPAAGIPEFCKVDGEILPVDQSARAINFSIGLPTVWNGRLLQLGGGGMNGSVVQPTAMPGRTFGAGPIPLARGYAVVGSDSGHAGSAADPSFMLNAEELRNFASDQLGKTHDVAMQLVVARYGVKPRYSYFIGGSEGGREALAAVQDFPGNFDGVIALYPFMAPMHSLLKADRMTRAMRAAGGDGWLSQSNLDIVRKAVVGACDAADGKVDDLIGSPGDCRFDFSQLLCANKLQPQGPCLSRPQVRTIEVMHGDQRLPYRLANGWSILPAFPVGADWGIGGFTSTSASLPDSLEKMGVNHALPAAMMRNLLFHGTEAGFAGFDALHPGGKLLDIQRMSALLDKTDPDIDRFVQHGGKLILFHGLADVQTNPNTTIAYFHALTARYGQRGADEFVRLYLIPGWGHGRGLSFNAANVPLVDLLEAWVEQAVAPGTLSVDNAGGSSSTRTMPLCRYPLAARLSKAGRFQCTSVRGSLRKPASAPAPRSEQLSGP